MNHWDMDDIASAHAILDAAEEADRLAMMNRGKN